MYGIAGAALVVAAIFLFAWAIVAFRDPNGPAWREKYLVLESLACLIVGIFAFGLALQFKFALQFEGALAWGLSIGVFVLLAVVYWAVWKVMGVAAKVAAFEEAEKTQRAPEALRRSA